MRNNKENKNSFTYAFKQQILRAWQPVPTLKSTVIIFIVLGLIFLAFGIALIVLSNQIIEYKQRYDEICPLSSNPCSTVQFDIQETIEPPIFLYYELDNFYQNHRRYLKSRDNDQLAGTDKPAGELDDCDPVVYVRDLDLSGPVLAIDNTTPLSDSDVAIPCGLVAKSFFNDEYALWQTAVGGGGTNIPIDENGIAWEADIKNKFKLTPNALTTAWLNVTNEHFIVWMRTAATPNFRKLWGRVNQPIGPGTYFVEITENVYDVSSFGGKKSVVLSTANAFGGKNYFLAIAYLVVGSISLIVALLFFIKDKVSPPRNLPKFD